MRFSTPVVVPAGSAAAAHASAAGGGLAYDSPGELLDAAVALMDDDYRSRLGEQGRAYVLAHHADMDDFVARMTALVLPDRRVTSASHSA